MKGSVAPLEATDLFGHPSDYGGLNTVKFIKLYKRNRETSATQPQDQEDSFHRALQRLMFLAQCFGLCPVQGINSKSVEDIRFHWLSARVFCNIVIIFMMITALVFSIAYCLKGNFSFDSYGELVFYGSGLLCSGLFLRLAGRWQSLSLLWRQIEIRQEELGYPKGLKHRINKLAAIILTLAFVEHLLAKAAGVVYWIQRSSDFSEVFEQLLSHDYKFIFEFIEYSPLMALLCEAQNLLTTFYWNFTDLFIIVLSAATASRFRLLNARLSIATGKVHSEEFWRQTREYYNGLSHLTKELDSRVCNIVLLSFATNLFFICQQLYNSMQRSTELIKSIYLVVSFGYLMFRTVAVSLFASSIYEESQATKYGLYSVPAESYKIEAHRLLFQITTDNISLTGCKFFTVTRTLILTLGGTVVTYVVILVQFNSNSGISPLNVTEICSDFISTIAPIQQAYTTSSNHEN